jgi:hypothetical protein
MIEAIVGTRPRGLAMRQVVAVGLLGRGCTCVAVGRELGVSERTVRRWRGDPRVVAEMRRWIEERERPRAGAALCGPPVVPAHSSRLRAGNVEQGPSLQRSAQVSGEEATVAITQAQASRGCPQMSGSVRECPVRSEVSKTNPPRTVADLPWWALTSSDPEIQAILDQVTPEELLAELSGNIRYCPEVSGGNEI